MKKVASLTLALAALGLVAPGPARAEEAAGKDLYNRKCAMCHGADGVAKEMWAKQGAKSFNDAAWQKTMTDAALMKTITDGVPDKKMPSYKDKLKPEEITAVIKHLRTLAPAK